VRRACEAQITIGAAPQEIWDVVSDVTRVGEWSGECQGCEWVAPSTSAVPGARFRGKNRRGGFRWTRRNEVTVADPPHELRWRTLSAFPYLDSTDWCLRLVAVDGGTEVTESFRIVKMSKVMERFLSLAMSAHNDRSADLAGDLSRLKALVESVAGVSGVSGASG
jgi:uncharacterized protein YndB with AHSA1/START domain